MKIAIIIAAVIAAIWAGVTLLGNQEPAPVAETETSTEINAEAAAAAEAEAEAAAAAEAAEEALAQAEAEADAALAEAEAEAARVAEEVEAMVETQRPVIVLDGTEVEADAGTAEAVGQMVDTAIAEQVGTVDLDALLDPERFDYDAVVATVEQSDMVQSTKDMLLTALEKARPFEALRPAVLEQIRAALGGN